MSILTSISSVEERAPLTRRRLIDKHGRTITDLRVSITDRCNYRCVYCRTGNQGAVYSELSIAEYLRVVVFSSSWESRRSG